MPKWMKITVLAALLWLALVALIQLCDKPEPPPAEAMPTVLGNLTQPREVFADGETYPNICVDVLMPAGQLGTLKFKVRNAKRLNKPGAGHVQPNLVTFRSSGNNKICATYHAPSSLRDVGRNEVIKVQLLRPSRGWLQTWPFPILAPPPRP